MILDSPEISRYQVAWSSGAVPAIWLEPGPVWFELRFPIPGGWDSLGSCQVEGGIGRAEQSVQYTQYTIRTEKLLGGDWNMFYMTFPYFFREFHHPNDSTDEFSIIFFRGVAW